MKKKYFIFEIISMIVISYLLIFLYYKFLYNVLGKIYVFDSGVISLSNRFISILYYGIFRMGAIISFIYLTTRKLFRYYIRTYVDELNVRLIAPIVLLLFLPGLIYYSIPLFITLYLIYVIILLAYFFYKDKDKEDKTNYNKLFFIKSFSISILYLLITLVLIILVSSINNFDDYLKLLHIFIYVGIFTLVGMFLFIIYVYKKNSISLFLRMIVYFFIVELIMLFIYCLPLVNHINTLMSYFLAVYNKYIIMNILIFPYLILGITSYTLVMYKYKNN